MKKENEMNFWNEPKKPTCLYCGKDLADGQKEYCSEYCKKKKVCGIECECRK